MKPRTIVAIDGPAGSGKSTVARALAGLLGVGYLDTGATYRLVARRALEKGIDPEDAPALAALARETMEHVDLAHGSVLRYLGRPLGDDLRTPEVSKTTSRISAHPEVRSVLVGEQRRLVPPQGAVVEGRDIGTVVWPEADLKVFLDARPEVRLERRARQYRLEGDLEAEISERDARDASRPVGTMRPAPDAVVIDTSDVGAEEVTRRILALLHPPPPPRLYRILRAILALILRTLFRLDARGAHHIPRYGPAILAPNHRSLIDHFVVAVLTRRQVWFMGKSELFRSPLAARFLGMLGAFPVKRGRPDRAALGRCLELLERGELVGIYPEGKRRPDARFEDVEEGFAYVAVRSGAPIVPIALTGTESVFPPGRRLPRLVRIRVVVGRPFRLPPHPPGVLPRRRLTQATAEARQRLQAVVEALEEET